MKIRPIEFITLRNRTPNPINKLFIQELRHLAKPLIKKA